MSKSEVMTSGKGFAEGKWNLGRTGSSKGINVYLLGINSAGTCTLKKLLDSGRKKVNQCH